MCFNLYFCVKSVIWYLEQRGISFTVWCFDRDYAPTLISDWNYTPTTSGRYFKAYLQSKKK
ncbi:MAG: hypothetical protein MJZ32_06705 [Bacteroidaceae bacterium]|nr:hypothetical protein [Bacteroidaceae bacterium]